MKKNNYTKKIQWDLIKFFTTLIRDKETTDLKLKKDILNFFIIASTFEGSGVNTNQQLIYKNLIPEKAED